MNARETLLLTLAALLVITITTIASSLPPQQFLTTALIDTSNAIISMAWVLWWALVFGFAIAGGVEAWVKTDTITNTLADTTPRTLTTATIFGFVSSSCSYSAIATAKNLYKKGASAANAFAGFQFAATNLVIEIGAVIVLLLGWEFLAANIFGGLILIVLLALVLQYLVPPSILEQAREHARQDTLTYTDPVCGMDITEEEAITHEFNDTTYHFCSEHCAHAFDPSDYTTAFFDRLKTREAWVGLAETQLKEWRMLWDDIAAGVIFASILSAFVPTTFWTALFDPINAAGLPGLFLLATIATALGVVTFVCSVGNIPFAALLWVNGLPFGPVLSFIYADLIIPPLVSAYNEYYNTTFAAILTATIFALAVVVGVLVQYVFAAGGLIPIPPETALTTHDMPTYRVVLNVLATVVFVGLYWLQRSANRNTGN